MNKARSLCGPLGDSHRPAPHLSAGAMAWMEYQRRDHVLIEAGT